MHDNNFQIGGRTRFDEHGNKLPRGVTRIDVEFNRLTEALKAPIPVDRWVSVGSTAVTAVANVNLHPDDQKFGSLNLQSIKEVEDLARPGKPYTD